MFCDTRNMSIHCKAVTHTDTLADKYTDILIYIYIYTSKPNMSAPKFGKQITHTPNQFNLVTACLISL